MIALEACLILETITAIPLSGAHSCLAQDSAQQLRARRGRNDGAQEKRGATRRRCRHQLHRRGGAATNATAAAAVSFFHAYKLDYCTNKHGVQFGPVKLGQLLFVCLWRLDMAMVIFKLW